MPQSKQQKQSAFEAEIAAHAPEHDALVKVGQDLVKVKHYASDDIAKDLEGLEEAWTLLKEQTIERG